MLVRLSSACISFLTAFSLFASTDNITSSTPIYDNTIATTETEISNADSIINNGVTSLKALHALPLVNNFGPEQTPQILDSATFPKDVADFMENLNTGNVQEIYEQLKKLPEGQLSSEVQHFLSTPELQSPEKLAAALKTMKIGPLTSLVYSISKADTKRIAKETWNKDHNSSNELLNIVTNVANNQFKLAAADNILYSSTVKKLISPQGIAELFGKDILQSSGENLVFTQDHVTAISYELKQNGYSEEESAKILKSLEDQMNRAIEHTSRGRFDMAAEALLKYEDTIKQYQINQIYTLNNLNAKNIEKLADSLKHNQTPMHKVLLEKENNLINSGLKNHILAGNMEAAKAAADNVIKANTNIAKTAILERLAATMNIKDKAQKAKLAAAIENNTSYQSFLKVLNGSFYQNIILATTHAKNGNSQLSAEALMNALHDISAMQHPENIDKIIQNIHNDFFEYSNNSFINKNTPTEEPSNKSSPIRLLDIEFEPPTKEITLTDKTSEVTTMREEFTPRSKAADYEHHESFTASRLAAHHNTKSNNKASTAAPSA